MKNLTTPHRCPANQIRYTTTDRRPIVITAPEQLDAKIVSNEYTEQGGIITFNRSLHRIGDNAFMGCSNLVTITLLMVFATLGKIRSKSVSRSSI